MITFCWVMNARFGHWFASISRSAWGSRNLRFALVSTRRRIRSSINNAHQSFQSTDDLGSNLSKNYKKFSPWRGVLTCDKIELKFNLVENPLKCAVVMRSITWAATICMRIVCLMDNDASGLTFNQLVRLMKTEATPESQTKRFSSPTDKFAWKIGIELRLTQSGTSQFPHV